MEKPEWFILQGNARLGPYTLSDLLAKAAAGRLRAPEGVWREGMCKAVPLEMLLPVGARVGVGLILFTMIAALAATITWTGSWLLGVCRT